MQSEKKVLDDLVKMVNGFAGTMAGMGREAEASMRERPASGWPVLISSAGTSSKR